MSDPIVVALITGAFSAFAVVVTSVTSISNARLAAAVARGGSPAAPLATAQGAKPNTAAQPTELDGLFARIGRAGAVVNIVMTACGAIALFSAIAGLDVGPSDVERAAAMVSKAMLLVAGLAMMFGTALVLGRELAYLRDLLVRIGQARNAEARAEREPLPGTDTTD